MIKKSFALLRTFVFAAFVPALALSFVACEPDNGEGGGGSLPGVIPEVTVPSGYANYFVEDLSFGRSGGEVKVAFQINVDWTMEVVGLEGDSASWCSVDPALGASGLHEVMVRVTENDTCAERSARVHLLSGSSKIAEIVVTQEEGAKYEAVDLGLSVKWASCNVGAESPEEYGGYYAWGETEEKSDYSWETYKWCNGSRNTLTKYCTKSSYGTVDNKTVLDPEDDVAHVKWGGNWRMPTKAEQDELCTECTWEWTTLNGVNGYEVAGPNGNSIFLPAAGGRLGTDVHYRGSDGSYWSATLDDYRSYYANCLIFIDGGYDWSYSNRYYGHTVRPVTD